MSDKKYYVMCGNNCKYEGMTKEQIMTAIEQAISTGEIGDVDTGFVTKIKEMNSGAGLSFWVGTQAEYNALDPKLNNCFYIITDDTTADDVFKAVEEMQKTVEEINNKINRYNAVLWEGTAGENQTFNCPNINNYNLFAVQMTDLMQTETHTAICYKDPLSLKVEGAAIISGVAWVCSLTTNQFSDNANVVSADIIENGTYRGSADIVKIIGIM